MDRTNAPGHVNHLFVAEDPATNRPPTEITAQDLNAHQEELISIILAAQIAPSSANNAQVLAALQALFLSKGQAGLISQNFSGLLRTLTPVGGALVREWADSVAATTGNIELGVSYNCAVDPATGVWAGRDVAEICWLEKWSDAGGVKEIWYAPTAAAGVVPAWTLAYSFDLVNGQISSSAPMDHDNLFANGSFSVWNSNNGQTNFVNPAATYTADQVMSYSGTTGQSTVSRNAWGIGDAYNVNNHKYYLQAVQSVAATDAPIPVAAYIEGVRAASGKKVFIRVRAWCAAGTVVVTPNFEQNFGTGGAPSVQVNTPTIPASITLTTTPQEFLLQVTVPSIAGKTLGANGNDYSRITMNCPSGATYTTSWDSLKISTKNTPFVPAHYGIDEVRCLRYYEICGGSVANDLVGCSGHAAAVGVAIESWVPYFQKRSVPTVSKVGTWSVIMCGQPVVGGAGIKGCYIQALATAAGKMNVATAGVATYIEVNARY